ncbi:MAG: TolC family protein [Candidatus Tantalella remota]|nr:TolC family protein [Candidatus Tantalella remota]
MRNSNLYIRIVSCLMVFAVCVAGTIAFAEDGKEPDLEGISAITLEECVGFALYNSFEVKMAKLDLLIAETGKLYAEAVFDTILFGDVNYVEDKRQQISVFAADDTQNNYYSASVSKELITGTEVTATWADTRNWANTPFVTRNPSHNAQLSVELRQPVGKNFFGYIDRNTLSVTKLAIRNAGLEMRDKIEREVARVEKAYWNLVYEWQAVRLREGILVRARSLNETNTKSYDMGIIERADLFASEANVLVNETSLELAENRRRRAEENLKLAMNMEEERRIFPAGTFPEEDLEYNLKDCLTEAFENRRDYKIRKRDIEINEINLKMKDNAMWPEIDLVGSMAMNGVEGDFEKAAGKTTVNDNTRYYAGVEFSMPLENSSARSEMEKAGYEKEKAIVALKETERNIITEVGNSFRDVITFNANVERMLEAVALQAGKLDEEEKRFQYGRSKTKTLIDYQNDLLRTEIEKNLVLLERELSRVDLERDMNVLLSKYEEAK